MNKKSKILIINKSQIYFSLNKILNERNYKNIFFLDYQNSINKIEKFFKDEKPEYVFLTFADEGGIKYNLNFPADLMNAEINSLNKFIHLSYKHKVKKLIYFASSCVYPKNYNKKLSPKLILTGSLEETNIHYASAKIMGINLCNAYNQQYQTNFIPVIPSNYFGPYDHFSIDYSHVICDLIMKFHKAKILNSDYIKIWGSGKPVRDFIYIDDVAKASIFLMQNYKKNLPINITSQNIYSIKQLAMTIKEVIKYKGKLIFDKSKPDGMKYKVLDDSEIKNLGWRSNSDFKIDLIKTYNGYLKN